MHAECLPFNARRLIERFRDSCRGRVSRILRLHNLYLTIRARRRNGLKFHTHRPPGAMNFAIEGAAKLSTISKYR